MNEESNVTEEESVEEAKEGEPIVLHEFEARQQKMYANHLINYYLKECYDVYSADQTDSYWIDCFGFAMDPEVDECLWAGTDYTTYIAFRNIASNYTTTFETIEWATQAANEPYYTNIVLQTEP